MNRITAIDKVVKLLKLSANNPNENEANSARVKAKKLAAKYEIDLSQLSEIESNNKSYEIEPQSVGKWFSHLHQRLFHWYDENGKWHDGHEELEAS